MEVREIQPRSGISVPSPFFSASPDLNHVKAQLFLLKGPNKTRSQSDCENVTLMSPAAFYKPCILRLKSYRLQTNKCQPTQICCLLEGNPAEGNLVIKVEKAIEKYWLNEPVSNCTIQNRIEFPSFFRSIRFKKFPAHSNSRNEPHVKWITH